MDIYQVLQESSNSSHLLFLLSSIKSFNKEIKSFDCWYEYINFLYECQNKDYSNLPKYWLRKHHIIPECYTKNLNISNNFIIQFSYEDHLRAHFLLWKGVRDNSTWNALRFVKNTYKKHAENYSNIATMSFEEFSLYAHEIMLGVEDFSGENNPSFGTHASEETKRKMSKAHLGQKHPTQSIKMKGENNPFYGKTHTEETRKIISEKAKQRPPKSKEVCKRQSEK